MAARALNPSTIEKMNVLEIFKAFQMVQLLGINLDDVVYEKNPIAGAHVVRINPKPTEVNGSNHNTVCNNHNAGAQEACVETSGASFHETGNPI